MVLEVRRLPTRRLVVQEEEEEVAHLVVLEVRVVPEVITAPVAGVVARQLTAPTVVRVVQELPELQLL